MKDDLNVFHTLAEMQLRLLIEKGKFVEECKAEWKSRYGVDYPKTNKRS
jgi:hypothetical protein